MNIIYKKKTKVVLATTSVELKQKKNKKNQPGTNSSQFIRPQIETAGEARP